MTEKTLKLEIDNSGVANLILDLPGEKVNKLSRPVLEELENILKVIDSDKSIKVLLITSNKKDIFIAGADINEIKDIVDEKDGREKVKKGQDILSKIADLKIPTIAVIDGACMGGGTELALACTYRIAVANKKTNLGLPEVNLGIIPGFGGTQRLPALIGLPNALKIILSGKAIDYKKAYKIGLIDLIVRKEFLENSLNEFVTEILKKNNRVERKQKSLKRKRYIFEVMLFGKSIIYYLAKKDLFQKTKGFYVAPFYALEVIKKTYGTSNLSKGLKIELDAFCELVVSDISKNLIELFFIGEEIKKDNGIGGQAKKVEIKETAVLGAGIMGGGIAWSLANADINVRMKDIASESIAIGYQQILKIFKQLKKIRKITQNQINMKMARVSSSTDYSGFQNLDLIIEAAPENIILKKNILSELEHKIKDDAIIASNTSSLSIDAMSHALKEPKRFVGMHFFNPVNRMPLVEIIKGQKTSDEALATVVDLAKNLKKTPIVVKDVSGFLVNRILLPFMNEAAYLLQDGADIKKIDEVIERFGMPMGPFSLADIVGIDVGVKVANSLYESYGTRMKVASTLDKMLDKHPNSLGKKSNKGFYNYPRKDINSDVFIILSEVRKAEKIQTSHIDNNVIIDRCILTMLNEAAKCLEEGVVKNARYLDMAMIMGTGFPAFRGGILRYADSRGIKNVVQRLEELNKNFDDRFEVSKLLTEMAKNNKTFY